VSARGAGDTVHRLLLAIAICLVAVLVLLLAVHGFPYYSLGQEERPFSPLHSQLRSSGSIGLKLGMLSALMFGVLFLYPLRKRWRWLGSIGKTHRWLNVHILFGITTPLVVTFHTSFKCLGLAGVAYWTMIAVALSGFVGRYVYAKIPRSLNSVELTMSELEAQTVALSVQLHEQGLIDGPELAPLLNVPTAQEVRSMGVLRTLGTMLIMDVTRPFHVSRIRRRLLPTRRIATLGGLMASHDSRVEAIIANLRRQSRLLAAMAFLNRTARIFHCWHVVHRPFSISFVALILVHIGVALSVGF
jgi:hypothetical protein